VAFWFGRFDVKRKMVTIEEKNTDIVGATSSIFDEESGHFSSQKSVKIKRHRYMNTSIENETMKQ